MRWAGVEAAISTSRAQSGFFMLVINECKKYPSSQIFSESMTNKQIHIQKFKEIYKRKEGKDLTDQEAFEYFEKLVVLVAAIYQPVPKNS